MVPKDGGKKNPLRRIFFAYIVRKRLTASTKRLTITTIESPQQRKHPQMNSPAAAIISPELDHPLDRLIGVLKSHHAARTAVLARLGVGQECASRQASAEMDAAWQAMVVKSRKREIACRLVAMAKAINQS